MLTALISEINLKYNDKFLLLNIFYLLLFLLRFFYSSKDVSSNLCRLNFVYFTFQFLDFSDTYNWVVIQDGALEK